ncbi:MAG TPA: hypothetical protein VF273_05605 [Pelobium sp.]
MKLVLLSAVFSLVMLTSVRAQQSDSRSAKFKSFTRAEISYLFGIRDAVNDKNLNSLHIKITIGLQNEFIGFGVGIENASYREAGGNGLTFQTFNLSGNAHVFAKPISTDELNFFLKAAAGYAPRIFRTYSKGPNYEIAPGILFTTKKKSKIYVEAMYQVQKIDSFSLTTGTPRFTAIGLGIGTWL